MNVFFNFRQPSPQLAPTVLLLLSYPLGKFAAYTLPITTYRLPSALPFIGGATFSLNPGPWNIKEHVLVFIMSNVAVNAPYAMNAIVVADIYYGVHTDYGFSLILILATQLTGFGIAGICRRFLVWPASMIWPQNLVACTLLNTLHAEDDEAQVGLTRFRYFFYLFGAAFLWMFLPGTWSSLRSRRALAYVMFLQGSCSQRSRTLPSSAGSPRTTSQSISSLGRTPGSA
jgi:hypothetical protein